MLHFSPEWISYGPARLHVRPAGQIDMLIARSLAEQRFVGIVPDGIALDEDQERRIKFGLVVMALAERCLLAWEGVGAEMTAENISALIDTHSGIIDVLAPKLLATHLALSAEGNASAPAPNGTTAAGQSTATGADAAA